jgi:type IV pilus biogenesis protein PilP
VNLRAWLPPLLAIAILAVVGSQTSEALRRSGTWRTADRPARTAVDPYLSLERAIATADTTPPLGALRDPFSYGRAPGPPRPANARPVVPPAPERPVVTAVLTDAETARAVVRYQGTSYSVKAGDLFAQYRVLSITADEVVVEDGRERLVLRPPTKGE